MDNDTLGQASGLSLRGRLAVALHCLARYVHRFRLHHPEIERFREHMWAFLPVNGPTALHEWEAADPPLVQVAIGIEWLDGFEAYLGDLGVDPAEFRVLLAAVFDIVDGSLYAAPDASGSLQDLADIFVVMKRHELAVPDPAWFADSPWHDDDGRGFPFSTAEIEKWRAAGMS